MNVGSPFVAYPPPTPLRQPGQGPFHDPAVETQTTPMLWDWARFFPHRRPPGDSDYQLRRGPNRSGRRREAWPGASQATVARPQCGAKRGGAASRSFQSRSPSLAEASPRECRTSTQREFLLISLDSGLAVCHPADWATQGLTVERATPRVRRVRVVWPCTHDTIKWGFVRISQYSSTQAGVQYQAARLIGALAITLATDFVDQLHGCAG